ncbi:predicted protein [Histoplasma mississippiense (nom. inval.)]|uniref:predicted protein n=1 Tax=Ajellomyces capsulatus (strain NAm1 / WU24) TaxID=2059318 RepID=UPI000157BF4E|nr:predicted protein [Histoplasma mississippiense (nom. inval.)]EDN06777.1 predicted protein [Histoplasma mississippiense (nom. inval.)]
MESAKHSAQQAIRLQLPPHPMFRNPILGTEQLQQSLMKPPQVGMSKLRSLLPIILSLKPSWAGQLWKAPRNRTSSLRPLNSDRFSSHWRWVVMIIALAVGFTFFALLLIYLKRRHKRKRANQPHFPSALPAVILGDGSRSAREPTSRNLVAAALADDKWGPQQHLAHTRAQGPGNAGSTPNISNRAESGQFTRAPQREHA